MSSSADKLLDKLHAAANEPAAVDRTSQPVFAFFVIVLLCSELPPPFNGVFTYTNNRVVKIHQHESDSIKL